MLLELLVDWKSESESKPRQVKIYLYISKKLKELFILIDILTLDCDYWLMQLLSDNIIEFSFLEYPIAWIHDLHY